MHPSVSQVILDNGVRLLTLPGPSPETAVVAVHVRSGFRTEPEGLPGLAHLFEHMLFERVAGFAKNSFLAALGRIGGYAAARTRHDYTEFFDIIPRGYLDRLLQLEGNRFRSEPPGAEAIDKQLKVINAEILEVTRSTTLGGFPWRYLPEMMYTRWQNSHDGYGDVGVLTRTPVDDIRECFYHAYAPANIVVTVAADRLTNTEKNTVIKHFGAIVERSAYAPATPVEYPLTADRHSDYVHSACPQPTTAVGLRLPDPVRYPRIYRGATALGTLIGILTGPDGPRVQTGWFGRPLDTGSPDAWIVIAAVPGDAPGARLTDAIRATLRSWATGEITDDQLTLLSAQLRIDGQRRSQEPDFAARRIGARTILYTDPETVAEADCHYCDVDCDDLVAAAEWLLPQPVASVTIRKERP